jgi:hypothetical protein
VGARAKGERGENNENLRQQQEREWKKGKE